MSNLTGKEFAEFYEAYQNVYTSQEVDEATAMARKGYDETQLRKRAGGGEAADRATSLENKPTYGDTNKAKQRQNYARAQRGDFRNTASSNPGLHVGQYKSNDPAVKAKQAARGAQRGALTPNEKKQLNMGYEVEGDNSIFEELVEFLYVEGYADTIEAAELIAEHAGEGWIEMILEKDETEIGITGQPIPKKKMSPAKRHEFEKKRRANLSKKPGEPGDSKLIQALRKKAQDSGKMMS